MPCVWQPRNQARRIGALALLLENRCRSIACPDSPAARFRYRTQARSVRRVYWNCKAGQRVLDACAAPGGKSAHVLETAAVALTCMDIDAVRCADVTRNLARPGWQPMCASPTASGPARWPEGAAYDRILADVPCSASCGAAPSRHQVAAAGDGYRSVRNAASAHSRCWRARSPRW
jgi:16S rRNA (cytosine967-C5)-methyltransferase